jgi:hypothetical protein
VGDGERGRIRTCDPRLKRALLYQLSYAPTPLNLTWPPQLTRIANAIFDKQPQAGGGVTNRIAYQYISKSLIPEMVWL